MTYTEEIIEYFDQKNNIGIAIQRIPGGATKTFSNYKTDELLAVFNYQSDSETCKVLSLKESISLTPFFITEIMGEEKIVSPISLFFDNPGSFKVSFI
jgi:hypothetical protein